MENKINWIRVNNDGNGNSRYVCHFHNLLTDAELSASAYDYQGRQIHPTKYEMAVKRANKIGGRKFHNKQYGSGIAFCTYSLKETEEAIERIKGE